MNTWYDKDGMDGKILNVICLATIAIFLYVTYLFFLDFLNSKDFWKEINTGIATVFWGSMSILFILSVIYKLKTIKYAILYSGRVSGECHYTVKFNINFEEIKAINEYKNNLIFKSVGLFSKETPGFEIELKSGKKYYVSPHLNDIASLRNTLLAGMTEQNRGINSIDYLQTQFRKIPRNGKKQY